MFAEDIGNRHENVDFCFRIKEELLEDEKEMLKNMSDSKARQNKITMSQKSWKKKTVYRRKTNELSKKIESNDVTEDIDLFYLGAALVAKVSEKNKRKGEKKQPWW